MILIDSKPFVLGKKLRKEFQKDFVFTIPPHKILWDIENNRYELANNEGIGIEYNAYLDLDDDQGQRQVRVRYYDSSRAHPSLRDERIFEPPFLLMTRGVLQLQQEQYEKAWFLVNHPNNGSNPQRGNNSMVFVTFNMEAIMLNKKLDSLAKIKALSYVYGDFEKEYLELKAVGHEIESDTVNRLDHGLANTANMGENELRNALVRVAERYPEQFLNYFTKSSVIIRNDVEKFKEAGILDYRSGEAGNTKGKWVMITGDDKQPEIEVCAVFKGFDAGDVIVRMFRDEDKKNMYSKLQSLYRKPVKKNARTEEEPKKVTV